MPDVHHFIQNVVTPHSGEKAAISSHLKSPDRKDAHYQCDDAWGGVLCAFYMVGSAAVNRGMVTNGLASSVKRGLDDI